MKVRHQENYSLSIADHSRLLRSFVLFGLTCILIVVVLSIYVGSLETEKATRVFVPAITFTMIGGPFALLMYYYFVLIKKVNILITPSGMESSSGIQISFDEISNTTIELNGNGINTLYIIKLKGERKFSITPTNRYKRHAMTMFDNFVEAFEAKYQESLLK